MQGAIKAPFLLPQKARWWKREKGPASLTSGKALGSTPRSHRFCWRNSCSGRRHSRLRLPWARRGSLDTETQMPRGRLDTGSSRLLIFALFSYEFLFLLVRVQAPNGYIPRGECPWTSHSLGLCLHLITLPISKRSTFLFDLLYLLFCSLIYLDFVFLIKEKQCDS